MEIRPSVVEQHFGSELADIGVEIGFMETRLKLQLHDAIYRLRFHSKSLIHILSLSNSHNNEASIQKNRGDKSHPVTVALSCNYTRDLSATILFRPVDSYLIAFKFAQ